MQRSQIGSGIGSLATGTLALVSAGVGVVANMKYKNFCASTVGSFPASQMMAFVAEAMNQNSEIFGQKSISEFSGAGFVRDLCNSYSNTTKLAIATSVVLATASIFLMRRACSKA